MNEKQLVCKKCDGDYVVGEGGRLECSKCGHIGGDISRLFIDEPPDQCLQPESKTLRE